MKRTNEHHEKYEANKATAREQQLKAKFEIKSFAKEYKVLFYLIIGATVLFQFASLLTALTLPASWVHSVCYNWGLGFIIAFSFLLLLEILKRIIISKAIKNGYQYKRWLSFGMFAGLLLSVASITSSTLGTPILIKEFGAAPTLKDSAAIEAAYLSKQSEIKNYWLPQIEKAEIDAKDTHDANKWKGVTTRKARPIVLEYQKKAQGYQDSLNNALVLASTMYSSALLSVDNHNKGAMGKDEQNKADTGHILGFITFGFELLFLLCTFWREYYDYYREMLELAGDESKTTKSDTKSSESADKSEEKQDESKSSSIGFFGKSEGHIFNNTIAFEKADKSLKYYPAHKLSSMIGDAEKKGKKERAKRLKDLRAKLIGA
jgi:hypothetical protein